MKLKPFFALCFIAASTSGCRAADTLSTLPPHSVVAVWNFDNDATPKTANGWSVELSSGTPNFVAGLNGQGVLVEEASRNFLSAPAAAATDAKTFEVLRGAALAVEKDGEYSALRIRTDGRQERQGVQVKANCPAGETRAWAVASLEIGGTGRVRVQLMDETNYTIGAPLFLELQPEMTRVSPPPIEVVVPDGELRLSVTSVDKSPADFRVAALQIEPLQVATSWMPGGTERAAEALEYSLSHATGNFNEGTLLVWVRPEWTNRTEPVLGSGAERELRTFFFLGIGSTGLRISWSAYSTLSSGTANLGGVDMFNGGWHLIALTWKGSSGTMYFNGNTRATSVRAIPPKAKLVFGPNLNATLDEGAFLSTALPKETLDKIFAAGKPKGKE